MEPIKRTYQTVKINSLRRHPLSLRIYGKEEESLADDIRQNGLQVPPQVTPDYMTLDGHRRIAGCKAAGLTEIPVLIRYDLKDDLDVERAIILANRYREKTNAQLAAEAHELLRIESEAARRRSNANLRKGNQSPEVEPVPPRENLDENANSTSKVRDRVGDALGVSGKTAEAAAEVHEAILEADEATAAELTETLNAEGVKPALRKVREAKAESNGEVKVVKDKLGNVVPGTLQVTFRDGDRDYTANILAIGKVISNIATLRQQVWGSRITQQPEATLAAVADTLRNERPWCGCPWCHGQGKIKVHGGECNRCLGTGWITRPIYDQLDEPTRKEIPGWSQ